MHERMACLHLEWVLYAIAALSLGATGCAVAAQSDAAPAAAPAAGPWFNLPLPGPVTEQVIDFAHADLPMIAVADSRGAAELDGSKVHRYVEDIVKFSYASRDAGERTWGRLAGTRWAEMTVDYVADQLRQAGLKDIVKSDVPFRGTERAASDWQVSLLGAPEFGVGSSDVVLQSAFPMSQRPEGPALPANEPELPPTTTLAVTAPVVYVGAGTPADIANRDIRGKIAVLRVEPDPGIFFSSAARVPQQLIDAGAASVIVIYNAPGNMQVHYGSCKNVPCFTLGGEDGEFLMMAIARAAAANLIDKLRLSLRQTIANSPMNHGFLLVAKLAGRRSDENLILSAHTDAWFAGANDNASGVAGLIALAKHYARGPRPLHDMYFVLSPGHHSPTAATQRFVDLYPLVPPANILAINLEHIGQQQTYRSYMNPKGIGPTTSRYGNATFPYVAVNWDSPGREIMGAPMTPALKQLLADAARRSQFTAPSHISVGSVAELGPLVAAGATGIQDVEVSIWYHTSGDTAATVAPESLQRALLFYKELIDQADKLGRARLRQGAGP